MIRSKLLLLILFLLMSSSPGNAQRNLTKIPDPDPEIERRSFQLADGFEVNLFASDPLLAKPIQMNFDAAGRLWLACSEVYPQIQPGQKANDKILILEDRDGDGKADKTTVFADGLLIPTGVEPGDGGAYVADSTELLHLRDTNGDGKADQRRVVLSGFGTEDTHHILHTLRWGPDGMLYFNQSVYIHSHIETPYGVRRLNAGGVWQFRPDTMRLEVFLHGFWNPWGHHFDRWGQSFVTDGAFHEGVNYAMPRAIYAATPGAVRVLPGMNPGSPKHCGAEILSGRHLPEDWRGNVITNDFRGNRVCRFVLREDGSCYTSQEKQELIKSNHPAFRPIDIKMGPDGAIYVADWYNPIIQHGEVDFRDPRRDHTHGRIWRVTAKGRPLVSRPALAEASTNALLEALKSPEDFTRHHAKRVLKDRGATVVPELARWIQSLDAGDVTYEHLLLEGLWTYQTLDVVDVDLLHRLLKARDHHARAAATRVLSLWLAKIANAQDLLAERIADDHPQVRLEAVRALGLLSNSQAVEIALRALDRPMDKVLDYSLWLTTRELERFWMPAFQAGKLSFDNKVGHLLFALQAVASPQTVRPLVDMVKAGKVSQEHEESVLSIVAAHGSAPDLSLVLDRVASMNPKAAGPQANLLLSLEQATRQRRVRPEGDLVKLRPLLTAENEQVRTAAVRLAGMWRITDLQPKLLEFANAPASSAALRRAALEGLVQFGDATSRQALELMCGLDHPLDVRQMAVVALAALDLELAARKAAEVLQANRGDADPTELFTVFVQRKNGATVLAKALGERSLAADVAKIGVRIVRSSGRDNPALVSVLTKAGNLTAVRRTLSVEETQQFIGDVAKLGDAKRGEVVYRRTDQSCLKCHAIAGAGGQVGPDLASIGASAPVDYLIDSLLQPNKAIKENYHSLAITTKDGRLFTGIKISETKTELVLRDAEDREKSIAIKDIEERTMGASLMPEALVDPLTRGELVDLVRFLSELGKVGPYSVSKARLVRRWQVLEPTEAARTLLRRTMIGTAAGNDPALTWMPAYSLVSGVLPTEALPRFQTSKESATLGIARCQFEASTGGPVKLRLNSAQGLNAWLDGKPLEVKDSISLDLAPGLHTLTIAVDLDQRREGLSCELEDVANSGANVRIVSGK